MAFGLTRANVGFTVIPMDSLLRRPEAPQVGALFRTLFALYMLQSDQSGALRKEIYNFVLKAVMKTPKFIMIAIDIGKCIFKAAPELSLHNNRPFLFSLLDELKIAMVASTDAEIIQNFPHVSYIYLLVPRPSSATSVGCEAHAVLAVDTCASRDVSFPVFAVPCFAGMPGIRAGDQPYNLHGMCRCACTAHVMSDAALLSSVALTPASWTSRFPALFGRGRFAVPRPRVSTIVFGVQRWPVGKGHGNLGGRPTLRSTHPFVLCSAHDAHLDS